jgi:hypothetical protein
MNSLNIAHFEATSWRRWATADRVAVWSADAEPGELA